MALRRFELTLTAQGPVHIGDGGSIGKRDYLVRGDSLKVLDQRRFVGALARFAPDQVAAYCDFLLEDGSRSSLDDFLRRHGLTRQAERSVAYALSSKLDSTKRGSRIYADIRTFVKDPEGRPYVPGSSVKGMLRNCLAYLLVEEGMRPRDGKQLDRDLFWREVLDPSSPSEKSDIMRYVSVADSDPLGLDVLCLAKKYDMFSRDDWEKDRKGNDLNIYRECLRPGTQVTLQMTVDARIDAYLPFALDAAGLTRAIAQRYNLYQKTFVHHFDVAESSNSKDASEPADGRCSYVFPEGPRAGIRCPNRAVEGTSFCRIHQGAAASAPREASCILGGGTDFQAKTLQAGLHGDEQGLVWAASRELYRQFPTKVDMRYHYNQELAVRVQRAGFEPKRMNQRGKSKKNDHRHWMDQQLGVSPHTLKMGKVEGRPYPMGLCMIAVIEVPV